MWPGNLANSIRCSVGVLTESLTLIRFAVNSNLLVKNDEVVTLVIDSKDRPD